MIYLRYPFIALILLSVHSFPIAEVAKWTTAPVLKTGGATRRGSSNLPLSVKLEVQCLHTFTCLVSCILMYRVKIQEVGKHAIVQVQKDLSS
ncbi:MAG: hypothetical protein PWQ49_1296 [Methanohalophilus sp.]|nr:hypothetical protein [Methanohalophilus sp.]